MGWDKADWGIASYLAEGPHDDPTLEITGRTPSYENLCEERIMQNPLFLGQIHVLRLMRAAASWMSSRME